MYPKIKTVHEILGLLKNSGHVYNYTLDQRLKGYANIMRYRLDTCAIRPSLHHTLNFYKIPVTSEPEPL